MIFPFHNLLFEVTKGHFCFCLKEDSKDISVSNKEMSFDIRKTHQFFTNIWSVKATTEGI